MSSERISSSFGADTGNARSPWAEVVGGIVSGDLLGDLRVRAEGREEIGSDVTSCDTGSSATIAPSGV